MGSVVPSSCALDRSSPKGTELCGFLDEVYVDEDARGLGMGAQLIDDCIDWIGH